MPWEMGGYDEDPKIFPNDVRDYARNGLLNSVGGCCETFPSHIAVVAWESDGGVVPGVWQGVPECLQRQPSGPGPASITKPESDFQLVGKRCNHMRIAKF